MPLKNKKPTSNRKQKPTPEPINQPAYINIKETSPELARKKSLLILLVAIFAIILLSGWLIVLRIKIKEETSKINLGQIAQQINNNLARFDTELKSRAKPQEINIEDLDSIKRGVEEQIKKNPDSSLWPTHEFNKLSLAIQYPDNWQGSQAGKNLVIKDATSTDSSNRGQATISLKDNSQRLTLDNWISKNSELINYHLEKPIFVFSSTSAEIFSLLQTTTTATSTINRIYLINSTSSKKIIEIKTESIGDNDYYQPLFEEIIRTIKIITVSR